MFVGPVYIDGYTGAQYAVALIGAMSVMVGAALVAGAALRAVLQRRWLAALIAGATAVMVPPFTAVVPVLGPYIEQWIDWIAYGPMYGYTPPVLPDLYWIAYGVPMAQGLGWIAIGTALTGSGLACHAMLPLRHPHRAREAPDA